MHSGISLNHCVGKVRPISSCIHPSLHSCPSYVAPFSLQVLSEWTVGSVSRLTFPGKLYIMSTTLGLICASSGIPPPTNKLLYAGVQVVWESEITVTCVLFPFPSTLAQTYFKRVICLRAQYLIGF